jgi:hypothetical protein
MKSTVVPWEEMRAIYRTCLLFSGPECRSHKTDLARIASSVQYLTLPLAKAFPEACRRAHTSTHLHIHSHPPGAVKILASSGLLSCTSAFTLADFRLPLPRPTSQKKNSVGSCFVALNDIPNESVSPELIAQVPVFVIAAPCQAVLRVRRPRRLTDLPPRSSGGVRTSSQPRSHSLRGEKRCEIETIATSHWSLRLLNDMLVVRGHFHIPHGCEG